MEEGSRDREFKVRLALSLSGHGFFSPQLWFVYFDLENCVQFLSDHVQEMKANQEVRRYVKGKNKQKTKEAKLCRLHYFKVRKMSKGKLLEGRTLHLRAISGCFV